MATVTHDEDDQDEGPTTTDLADAARAFNDEPEPPRRNGVPPPATLDETYTLAAQKRLEPFRRGTKHPEVVFWCPICQASGRQATASVEIISGVLTVNCAGCHDELSPGVLTALALPTSNVITLHPERNGDGTEHTSVRHLVTLLDLDQLLANPPPDPDFAWGNQQGGYIELGTLAVLHGDGGLGKSLIGQGLCRRYTLGKEWLGQQCSGGIALYLDGENSEAEIARRLFAFEFRPGEERLKYGRVSFPILFDPNAGEALMDQLIEETNATLIVLDSQRALWGGDEKEQSEVRPMYAMLARVAERLNIAILLIHHDNKSGLYSGSTDINAAVVSRIHLERASKTDRKDRRRIIWHEKSRSGPEQPPVIFSVDKSFDGLLTFQIHDEDTPTPPGVPRSDMRQRVLELLEDRVHRTRSEVANELGIDRTNGTLRRLWNDLIDEQILASSDNRHWGAK